MDQKLNLAILFFGLPSSGLHTNGFSLARKIFFDVGRYKATDSHSDLEKNIGETLRSPILTIPTLF